MKGISNAFTLLFFIFIFVFSFSSAILSASAATTITIEDICSKTEVTASIMINDVVDVATATIKVAYNSSVIEVTNAAKGDFPSFFSYINADNGWVNMTAYTIEDEGLSGDVKFAELTIAPREGSEGQISKLDIDAKISDSAQPPNTIPATAIGGYFGIVNCDDYDGCHVYGNGCENRNYYCSGGYCAYSYSNRHTDYYGDWVNYCKVDEVWERRLYHNFYCVDGSCSDHTSLVGDQGVENCNEHDSWVDTGNTKWIEDPGGNECKEKEQKEQEYQDYTCSGGSCDYTVTDTSWEDTGEVRNKTDGTVCGCTANSTLKKCYVGTCSDTGICNSAICGADATCDGKKPGEVCGMDSKCNSTCKCVCNQPPIASFTYSPLNAAVNETITFNASNSTDPDGFITHYEWNFEDGKITNTTEEIITHLYSSAGNYTVSLTVTDNDGAKDTTTIELTLAIKGDLNGDGFVTMDDVRLVAGMVIGTVKEDLKADFNGNGYVDVGDAAKLLGYVKGKVGSL
jgi:hypothetical protein